MVAEEMGCTVICEYDVGVAGIHRLFPCLEKMAEADALVVVAGREGTLPAVVAGTGGIADHRPAGLHRIGPGRQRAGSSVFHALIHSEKTARQ